MGRLFLKSGDIFGDIGGLSTTDVFGTNGNETVFVSANGKANFDPSFNRGGDTIEILGNASTFTIVQSASNVVLTALNGARVSIPIGQPTNVNFLDADRVLSFDGTNIKLGAQVITTTAAPVAAGQAPASAEVEAPLSSELQSSDVAATMSDNGGSVPHLVVNQTLWAGDSFA
jgi:hypothetical protein